MTTTEIIYWVLYLISLAILLYTWMRDTHKLTLMDLNEALLLSLVLTGIVYFLIVEAEAFRDWYKKYKLHDPVLWQRKEEGK